MIQDGEYGRISLGRHNSIFIGGIAHELGHASACPIAGPGPERIRGPDRPDGLGQPHLCGGTPRGRSGHLPHLRPRPPARLASAVQRLGQGNELPRAGHPLGPEDRGRGGRTFLPFPGRAESPIPVYAAIAYLDPEGGGDYDARTVVSIPDGDGRIDLACGPDALVPGKAGTLRVVTCLVNGATSTEQHDYRVDAEGRVDLETMRISFAFAPFLDAVESKDRAAAESLAKAWPAESAKDASPARFWRAGSATPGPRFGRPEFPRGRGTSLSHSLRPPKSRSAGASRPTTTCRGATPCFSRVANCLRRASTPTPRPACLRSEGWGMKTLKGACGLPAGGGSVVFVVIADGREVFRSNRLEEDGSSGSKSIFPGSNVSN